MVIPFIQDGYVVVQFYPWFKFSFLLFLGMVMYDNNMIMSLKQKKRKFEPRIKLNHNSYTTYTRMVILLILNGYTTYTLLFYSNPQVLVQPTNSRNSS